MNVRASVLAAWVLAAGALGWALLQPDWAPARPGVACAEVFAEPLRLSVPAEPRQDFVVEGRLTPDRPAVVVQHQLVDANGFGWINRSVGPAAGEAYRVALPRVPRTHTIRVGVLAPAEAERAGVVRAAARAFDAAAFHAAQGWVAPMVTVCQTFEVREP